MKRWKSSKDGGVQGAILPMLGYSMRYLPMDQAGWHTTAKLTVTDNICILTPPSRSPEPNPVENIRRFMRENWLSNRVFNFYNDIVDHCRGAWKILVDRPWIITSSGMRDWPLRF